MAVLAVACLVVQVPAVAQTEMCESLRQQLAAGGGDPGRAAQFARATQRQRQELARTQSYADGIGCGAGFSFFDDPPPQCGAIEDQIHRMQANLAALEAQVERLRNGDPDREAVLAERYTAACGLTQGTAPLPGIEGDDMRPGFDVDPNAPPDDVGSEAQGGKPICVRTCDGGYFPLGVATSGNSLDGLQSLCSALCPNTEAKLYTVRDTDDLQSAVALDGTPYSTLPAAFKFQKSFDAACTCKPPGQSWVQALAQAEELLEKGSRDVTVTRQMSDAMARPGGGPALAGRKKPTKAERRALVDLQAAAESALGAQAPTAGVDSAGIANAALTPDRVVKTGEGMVKDVPGPDGAKRRVRIIGPALAPGR